MTSFVDAFAIAPYFGSWTSADTDLESFVANKLPAQVGTRDLIHYEPGCRRHHHKGFGPVKGSKVAPLPAFGYAQLCNSYKSMLQFPK